MIGADEVGCSNCGAARISKEMTGSNSGPIRIAVTWEYAGIAILVASPIVCYFLILIIALAPGRLATGVGWLICGVVLFAQLMLAIGRIAASGAPSRISPKSLAASAGIVQLVAMILFGVFVLPPPVFSRTMIWSGTARFGASVLIMLWLFGTVLFCAYLAKAGRSLDRNDLRSRAFLSAILASVYSAVAIGLSMFEEVNLTKNGPMFVLIGLAVAALAFLMVYGGLLLRVRRALV